MGIQEQLQQFFEREYKIPNIAYERILHTVIHPDEASLVALTLELEKEFNVVISDYAMDNWEKVGDIFATLNTLKYGKNTSKIL